VRLPVALYLVALGVRLAFLVLFPDPAYPDSSYYVDVARALQNGQGFNVDFIWIFAEVGGHIPPDPHLPIPSNAHWMPLASIVQVPFLLVAANNQLIAGLPFALIGALAAPLTWFIARDAGASRLIGIAAALLVASPAAAAVFFSQPDNFGLYQPLVIGALWLTARGLKGDARSFALGGLLVGLATLARNDGVLVGLTIAIAFAWNRWRAWRVSRDSNRVVAAGGRPIALPAVWRIPLWSAVACFGLLLVVVTPWFIRQLVVFGNLLPSSASGRVLFIRDITEWNSVVTPTTLSYLLGQGIGSLVASRVGGFVAAVGIYAILVGALFLVPFMVIGAWRRRMSVDFGPFFVYAIILFAFSSLVSAVHVPGGTFIHSAVALAPYSYILAMEGLVAGVAWIARRRPSWNVEQASKVFVGGAVVLSIAASAFYGLVVVNDWSSVRLERESIATALNGLNVPTTDRLMSIDASGFRYYTGRGGVVSPDDPIDTVEDVARAYDIRWLILERRDIVRSMEPILLGGPRPAWIGAPVYTYDAPTTNPDLAGKPAAVVYPVCTQPGDTRCAA
jgi:hypothetical protein